MNIRDLAVFAVIMFVASIVAGFINSLLPSMAALGVVGTVIAYVIVLLPSYWLLTKFWRRRRG